MFELEFIPRAAHEWPYENQSQKSDDMQPNVEKEELGKPDSLDSGKLSAEYKACEKEND